MRARVDELRCEGQGRCYAIAPDVFHPDEIGHAQTSNTDVPDEWEDDVRQAADACPERAITVSDQRPVPEISHAHA